MPVSDASVGATSSSAGATTLSLSLSLSNQAQSISTAQAARAPPFCSASRKKRSIRLKHLAGSAASSAQSGSRRVRMLAIARSSNRLATVHLQTSQANSDDLSPPAGRTEFVSSSKRQSAGSETEARRKVRTKALVAFILYVCLIHLSFSPGKSSNSFGALETLEIFRKNKSAAKNNNIYWKSATSESQNRRPNHAPPAVACGPRRALPLLGNTIDLERTRASRRKLQQQGGDGNKWPRSSTIRARYGLQFSSDELSSLELNEG